LTIACGEPVTKSNLQAVIRRRRVRTASALPNRMPKLAVPEVTPASPPNRELYWGERIDVSTFRGRETELQQLERWLGVNAQVSLWWQWGCSGGETSRFTKSYFGCEVISTANAVCNLDLRIRMLESIS
jgi:hypothetical protein